MPAWAWIIIAIVILALATAAWFAYEKRRTQRLRDAFGPEYELALSEAGGRRQAESELETRRKRRARFDLKPLSPEESDLYKSTWKETQARFVDGPVTSLRAADRLVTNVMRDRGYPMEDFEIMVANVSVDHPSVVSHYRSAHEIFEASGKGRTGTEELRQAMIHYRAIFETLVEPEEPVQAEEPSDKGLESQEEATSLSKPA
jgi:hypothetical protein